MKTQKHIIAIALLVVSSVSISLAGGWTEKKGEGYFKLGQSWVQANGYYDVAGNRIPIRTIGSYTTSIFGRYGITDKWTVFANIPVLVRHTLNETKGNQTGEVLQDGTARNGFGDVDLGVQYSLFNKKGIAMSASVALGLPTGSTNSPDGLFTGDGEFNQRIQYDIGYGNQVKKQTLYANAYVGFNHRTKGFSEELSWGLEVGAVFWSRVFIAAKVNGLESFQNSKQSDGGIGLFGNNVEFIMYGPEVAYIVNDQFGVSFNYWTATKIRNALASKLFSVGAFYKLKAKKKPETTPAAP